MQFVVIDLECTSREAAEAHIVEWACVIKELPWFGAEQRTEYSSLVRPPIAIPPETSAIHHIIDADVAAYPMWEDVGAIMLCDILSGDAIGVAHNAEYERTVLNNRAPSLPKVRWLCTYKAALRVWPDAPSHSNEALRYWLGLGTGRSHMQNSHSALHDARVTAQLLDELLKTGASVDDMIAWTDEPAMLPRCPLGDWRGYKWTEVEESFLRWILGKAPTMRVDVVFCARKELERRDAIEQADAEALRALQRADDGGDGGDDDILF